MFYEPRQLYLHACLLLLTIYERFERILLNFLTLGLYSKRISAAEVENTVSVVLFGDSIITHSKAPLKKLSS